LPKSQCGWCPPGPDDVLKEIHQVREEAHAKGTETNIQRSSQRAGLRGWALTIVFNQSRDEALRDVFKKDTFFIRFWGGGSIPIVTDFPGRAQNSAA